MPGKSSAAKHHRQNLKRRLRNKMVKSRVRSSAKRFAQMIEDSSGEEAQTQYRKVASLLDRAVSKGVIHRNTAARKKHRLHQLLGKTAKPS